MKSRFHNWSDVRVFLVVLRRGSTLAASKELGLAQVTVARRVEALEHALDLTLFERDTRGFHPTGAAIRLRPAAEAMEAAVAQFGQAAERARATDLQPIRLTAPRVNFSDGLAAILAEFAEIRPRINFECISSYTFLDLAAGEADVAIRIYREVEDDRLICRRMTTALSTLHATAAYANRHGLPASADEFAGHRFVAYAGPHTPRLINDWMLARIGPD
ncbi:LysR family transcriptional regulator [Roseisalinus antarcticus]|uniref:HTH-type transcriptional regulator DmlR n=1 Tax=Roseisalinus antarcticus TaxID=254357 RepID=A0A1Y5SL03_9RHOB|nr:HTH-type transcriptional regulator DmlR [Roseisalinus antarcticus]